MTVERGAAIECAEVLHDMGRRIESPSAAGSYLMAKGVRAIYAVLELLDVVTQGDSDWRDSLREHLHQQVDRRLADMRP